MSGPSGRPAALYQQARAAQRRALDLARAIYPAAQLSLARNRGAKHMKGIQFDSCMLVETIADGTRRALLFESSWVKLHALVVDVRRERLRTRERENDAHRA